MNYKCQVCGKELSWRHRYVSWDKGYWRESRTCSYECSIVVRTLKAEKLRKRFKLVSISLVERQESHGSFHGSGSIFGAYISAHIDQNHVLRYYFYCQDGTGAIFNHSVRAADCVIYEDEESNPYCLLASGKDDHLVFFALLHVPSSTIVRNKPKFSLPLSRVFDGKKTLLKEPQQENLL